VGWGRGLVCVAELEGVGAEKDCSKGLGSRFQVRSGLEEGRRSGGRTSRVAGGDHELLEVVSGWRLMTEGIKQRHQFPFSYITSFIGRRLVLLPSS